MPWSPVGPNIDARGDGSANGRTSFSVDQAAQHITRPGLSWGSAPGQPATVTYGFRASAPGTVYGDYIPAFSRFSAQQIQLAELMLQAWSDVAGITFVRIGSGAGSEQAYTNNATLLFSNYSDLSDGAAAFAYLPGPAGLAGDVWINASRSTNQDFSLLGYGALTMLHEIGHAIGLDHPGDYNAGGGSITYSTHAEYAQDSRQYSVMSYFTEHHTGADFRGNYASAPLLDDIAAAQRLYGANMATRTGDTIYGFNSTAERGWFDAGTAADPRAVIFAVWDAGGFDTFDFSGYSQSARVDLRQGHFSSVGGLIGNVSIAVGAMIERAIGGAGADTLIGSSGANVLRGGAGADQIDGGAGSDTAEFAGFRADYSVTTGVDEVDGMQIGVVIVMGPDGEDRLRNVEFLRFADQTVAAPAVNAGVRQEGDLSDDTLAGSSFADWLYGADGNDILEGSAGDDVLLGWRGDDRLIGGDGNDLLVGGRGADVLIGGEGQDEADYSQAGAGLIIDLSAWTAVEGSETDTLSGVEHVTGGVFDDVIRGDEAANTLRGGGGRDRLYGLGGDDVLVAGAGRPKGAEDVIKPATVANTSRQAAVNIDAAFDLMTDPEVEDPYTPHAIVRARGSGAGAEFYALTVTSETISARLPSVFDIVTADFNTILRLYDEAGNLLAVNDNRTSSDLNAHLRYTFTAAGRYYIEVASWTSGSVAQGNLQTAPPPAGAQYTLSATVYGHAYVPTFVEGSELDGGVGDDWLEGGDGNDLLEGGAGDDRLIAGTGDNRLDGGSGVDVAVIDLDFIEANFRRESTGEMLVSGAGRLETLRDVEAIQFRDLLMPVTASWVEGSGDADTLEGTDANDTLNGLGGADVLRGGLGDDVLFGGDGSDRLEGGAGRDVMAGGRGSDVYLVDHTGDIVVEEAVFGGRDEVIASVDYRLAENVELLTLTGSARVGHGNSMQNIIRGTDLDNILSGGGDADYIYAGGGVDIVVFTGQRAQYEIDATDEGIGFFGPDGLDVVFDAEFAQFDDELVALRRGALYGTDSADEFTGHAGADLLYGFGDNDILRGMGGDDELYGGAGNDLIYGGASADRLMGGDDEDRLFGETGDDILEGGGGADHIDGGDGWDEAVFRGDARDYSIFRDGDGYRVKSPDGSDYLTRVEILRFDDGSVDLTMVVCDPFTGAISIEQSLLPLPDDRVRPAEPDDLIICPGVSDENEAKDAHPLVQPGDEPDLGSLVLLDQPVTSLSGQPVQGFLGRWMLATDAAVLQARADTFDGRDPHGLRWLLRERPDARLDDAADTPLPPQVPPAEVGPKELFDAPLICFDGGPGSDNDTVKDDWIELDDPLVLPLDVGPKTAVSAPVVCDTGAGPDDPHNPLAFVTDTEALLSERGPNRLMSQPTWIDWVW